MVLEHSFRELVHEILHNRRLQVGQRGDPHLLGGGVFTFDGLEEDHRSVDRRLLVGAEVTTGPPTMCFVCPSFTFTTFLAMCAITGIKLSAV